MKGSFYLVLFNEKWIKRGKFSFNTQYRQLIKPESAMNVSH